MKSLFALAVFVALPAFAGVIEGRVIEVPDGRTVTVLSSNEGASLHRVRLAGIDAPLRERSQGNASRESLRRLMVGKTVRVETSAIDAKGLLVGIVLVMRNPKDCRDQPCPPLLDPGLTQLKFGFATIDKANLSHQDTEAQQRYVSAEAEARTKRLGVWRDPSFQLRTEVVQTR